MDRDTPMLYGLRYVSDRSAGVGLSLWTGPLESEVALQDQVSILKYVLGGDWVL